MSIFIRSIGLVLFTFVLITTAAAQEDKAAELPKPPTIPDDPKTVDPADHVPKKLAQEATVEFTDKSLREIAEWIQTEHKIPVLFDTKALGDAGIAQGEPVTDRLDKEPVYLLLNRLQSLRLAWYVEQDILRITTIEVASNRMTTKPYNVSDLLDSGLKQSAITDTIHLTTSGHWESVEGEGGGLEWLGDVLFVRQTDGVHREVSGLFAALRKHGRQTYTLDPPQHGALREKLAANVSVRYIDTPLSKAVEDLAKSTKADIRLDQAGLRAARVRDREPITLTLSDRPLSTTLHVMLADLGLTWILRDGILQITSLDAANDFMKTAVYDVRDLCRDNNEADALSGAILSQTTGPWEENDGVGGRLVFARPGALVVRQTETILNEVDELLATYRKALLASKPRKRSDTDEISTRYYRIHEDVANDLVLLLPVLVEPKSWQTEKQPSAKGTVLKVASQPKAVSLTSADKANKQAPITAMVGQSVLIIQQTRSVHEKISSVIRRIENGDPPLVELQNSGGGFGGGFFSLDSKNDRPSVSTSPETNTNKGVDR